MTSEKRIVDDVARSFRFWVLRDPSSLGISSFLRHWVFRHSSFRSIEGEQPSAVVLASIRQEEDPIAVSLARGCHRQLDVVMHGADECLFVAPRDSLGKPVARVRHRPTGHHATDDGGQHRSQLPAREASRNGNGL